MDVASSDVAEDERVIALPGLIGRNRGISAIERIEIVLARVGNPGGETEEESLYGNDVNSINTVDAIHIRSR